MRTALLLAAAACASAPRPRPERSRLEPLLLEAIRFPTVAGNEQARLAQQQWLLRTAASLGLTAREAGPVTEVELPGPQGAPVLGLVVHGDVQPVEAAQWTVPPFAGVARDGVVYGRGAADDKGPLVQALLAMNAIRDLPRTHAVRLLVGSDEESGSTDIGIYLASHAGGILGWPVPEARAFLRDLVEHATQRQIPAGHAFGEGDEVRLDPPMAEREPSPGAAEPGDHLVGDQQHIVAIADLA